MRSLALSVMVALMVSSCGGDARVDRARPTVSADPAVTSSTPGPPALASPPADPIDIGTTASVVVSSTTTTSAPEPTVPPTRVPVTSPPPSDDGLGDSITVTDSVSIVVLDPEDT